MESDINKTPIHPKVLRLEAMKYGAFLGIITVALELLPKLWQSGAGILYFFAKTAICIWLLVFFTRKFVAAYDGLTRSHTFKFGMFTALFSALVVSAAVLVELKMMDNGAITDLVRSTMEAQGYVTEDMADSIGDMVIKLLPIFTFIMCFIKCFVIGLLAALVISRSIPGKSDNPFEQR